jgi:hypothetical protein
MNNIPIEKLTLEMFSPLVNSKFKLSADDGDPVDVKLTEANTLDGPHTVKPDRNGMVQEVFSLMFDGPENPTLPQRIYSFEHEQIGRFDLFIVPVKKIPAGIRYQALFNRLVRPK